MALKVFWTDFSKKELDEIFAYSKKRAGSRIAPPVIHIEALWASVLMAGIDFKILVRDSWVNCFEVFKLLKWISTIKG